MINSGWGVNSVMIDSGNRQCGAPAWAALGRCVEICIGGLVVLWEISAIPGEHIYMIVVSVWRNFKWRGQELYIMGERLFKAPSQNKVALQNGKNPSKGSNVDDQKKCPRFNQAKKMAEEGQIKCLPNEAAKDPVFFSDTIKYRRRYISWKGGLHQ